MPMIRYIYSLEINLSLSDIKDEINISYNDIEKSNTVLSSFDIMDSNILYVYIYVMEEDEITQELKNKVIEKAYNIIDNYRERIINNTLKIQKDELFKFVNRKIKLNKII